MGAVRWILLSLLLFGSTYTLVRVFQADSEIEAVRNAVRSVVNDAQCCQGDSLIERAFKAKLTASQFEEPFWYRLPSDVAEAPLHRMGRRELQQGIVAAQAQLIELEVKLTFLSTEIVRQTATVQAEVSVLGKLRGETEQFFDQHRGRILLKKDNDMWLIHSVLHEENLRDSH